MQPYTHFFSGIDKPYIPLIQPIQPYTYICIYIFNKKNNSCRVLGAPSFPKLNKNYYIIKPYIHLRCGGELPFQSFFGFASVFPRAPYLLYQLLPHKHKTVAPRCLLLLILAFSLKGLPFPQVERVGIVCLYFKAFFPQYIAYGTCSPTLCNKPPLQSILICGSLILALPPL